jgi:hypothetical protein
LVGRNYCFGGAEIIFYLDDGGSRFLWNTGTYLPTVWSHIPHDCNLHKKACTNSRCQVIMAPKIYMVMPRIFFLLCYY